MRYVADPAHGRPEVDLTGTPRDSDIIGAAVPLEGGSGGAGALALSDYQDILGRYLGGIEDAALLVAACETFLDQSTDGVNYLALVNTFIGLAEVRPRQVLFFIGEMPPQRSAPSADQATNATVQDLGGVQRSNFAGLYWPFLIVADPIGIGLNPTLTLPPSGHLAGVFARTDARRGVWKAPAGVESIINGSLALSYVLDDGHSDELNPRGINALRQIPAAGRVIWGARTVQPNSEWRYNAVRRTAIFLRTSIYNGIQWAVFEPNDEPLWQSLRVSIGGFMETQFRNGAFAGATSDQAYFVKVDSETTTEIDRAAGIVNILVGFAPQPVRASPCPSSRSTRTASIPTRTSSSA